MAAQVEIFQGAGEDKWYWHLRAANGEIVAQSEGYGSERDANRGADDAIAAALEVAAERYRS